ncbi:unnamed protein product [Mytilus coruscus]|uniref:Uncharacterized protein n=1 Tax=Mytilus coruscus TaxID=42192 RepID=A0A6J8A699_MYTCO|nr:unnamed protein product [Mytilus coruscus]
MDKCMICNDNLNNGKQTVQLRDKGSSGINKASRERGETILVQPGQSVHQECRRVYCNPKAIDRSKKKTNIESNADSPNLRSQTLFSFADHCLFCGLEAKILGKKKGQSIFPVRTEDFQTTVDTICNERGDEWATQVKGRLECARDFHAADAIYHQSCSVNFRTNKHVPQAFSPPAKRRKLCNRGRPKAFDD